MRSHPVHVSEDLGWAYTPGISTLVPDPAEFVVIGEVAYFLPAIRPDMSPRLRRLLAFRREATIAGQCPRSSARATGGAPLAPRLGELVMAHERWCPVADDTVGPLLARYWQARAGLPGSDGGGATHP